MALNSFVVQAVPIPINVHETVSYGTVTSNEQNSARPAGFFRGIWNRMVNSTTHSADVTAVSQIDIPDQYQDCTTYHMKVAWINSERGENILSKRPVLLEYHKNGRLLRMMQNKHWDIRLNEWLFIHEHDRAVPLGLGFATHKELKPREHKELAIYRDNPPIPDMFRHHPAFLTQMTFPTEAKYNFLTDGYTTFAGIIPPDVVDAAVVAISRMVVASEEFKITAAERQKNPNKEGDPFFTSGGTNDRDVLALYYCSPIFSLVESILHDEILGPDCVAQGKFVHRAHGAQVAFRFTQARLLSSRGDGRIGGKSWHLDGMDKGLYGPFSLLIGVALSDQMMDNCGNLGVHPGSHHTLKAFLRRYCEICDHTNIDTADEQAVMERRLQAVNIVHNKPILGEPVQVKLRKGDVVFALHKLAHLGTPNYSNDIRKMVYFRVSHRNLEKIRGPALDDLWMEYEGMKEVVY